MEAIYNNTEDADGKTTSSENRRRETRRFHAGGVSSQRESLREKLTEQHYLTEDEVRIMVLRAGVGCTPDNIGKLSKSTMDSIKQEEFVDPRKERKDATQVSIGRALYEFCLNMIIPCGESVATAIKYNFQANRELDQVSQKKAEIMERIIVLKQSSGVVHRPDMAVYNGRIEIAVGKQQKALYQQYKSMYQTRVYIPILSPPLPEPVESTPRAIRSTSRTRGQTQAQQEEQQAADNVGAAPVEAEVWETSKEHAQYQKELSTFEKDKRMELLEAFMTQQDSWERYELTKTTIEAQIMQLEEERMSLQAQELMFQEMRNQINMIVQKVKTAAQPHSFVRVQLEANVVVNEESIDRPWHSDNLCGIFHILHREYSTATFELFCTFLMDLLSITASSEEIATNPYVVAQRTDAKLKMWIDFKFDEFMTRDHLFTIANLKTLQGDMRKDAMTRVLEKAHQLRIEGDSTDVTLEYTDMPLYSALVRYEQTVSETSTFPSSKGSVKDSAHAHMKTVQKDVGALEQAAATTEILQKKKRAEGIYSREVSRDEDLWTSQGNFRYIALLKPCPVCRKGSEGHTRPRCFRGQCNACGYFGHMEEDCKHAPRTDFKSGGARAQS